MMMEIHSKKLYTQLILNIMSFFYIGCTTTGPTKPNVNIFSNPNETGKSVARMQETFSVANEVLFELTQQNPLITSELGKLPELQDGISKSELISLEKIVNIYKNNKKKFEEAFSQMYQVGKPNFRKYCSPLQAFFWLIEDGKVNIAQDTIKNYSLDNLLENSWDFRLKTITFSDDQISSIIENTSDNKWQKLYKENVSDKNFLQRLILMKYEKNPGIYNGKAKNIIKDELSNQQDDKWSNFDKVSIRLNSPELIDFWTQKNLTYSFYLGTMKSNQSIFKSKNGNCEDTSSFIVNLLRKAGYEANTLDVVSKDPNVPFHVIVKYQINDSFYLMDNGTFIPAGIMGPFKSMKESSYKLHY